MFENPVNLNQGAPEAIRIGWVVGAMSVVLAEGNSARYLRRQLGDFDRDLQVVQVPHDELVELGNAARLKRDASLAPVAGHDPEEMRVEIEFDFEGAFSVRYGRRVQSACRHIQRHMPGMIEPWRQGEPYLADDLRPEMKRLSGIFPGFVRQLRPEFVMR